MRPFDKLRAVLAGLLIASAAHAADPYPSKPVMMMVPYPAGGPSDVIGRALNGALGKQLGQPVVVENLGGVSGAIGAQKVLSAPADGYYLFLGSPNEVILSPLVNASVRFKAEDFRLVQAVSLAPMVLVTRKDLPAGNADELIALARSAGDKPLTYGSVGIGSLYHLLSEHLGQVTGTRLVHVPYKGVAPLLQELGGGNIDFAILPYGAQIQPMAEQGRLKILGSVATTRPETLKDLPTVNEGKALKDFGFTTWAGLFVKKDTPEAIVQRLHKAVGAVLQEPAVRSALDAQRQIPAPVVSLQESEKFYESETARFRALAKSINLQPQ